ncbi:MAG: glycosyltransferase family 2 protein [Desulfuromonas sp.]|nr:glycosyltransferase family 2 protein [Desulfuromonas sp.]
MTPDQKHTLSVLVPVYNEEQAVRPFLERLVPILAELGCHYEILFIDDGSQDATCAIIRLMREQNPCIKLIKLSRNFGKERALSAGLDYCTGDAVIPIDVDLQDPPELIGEFISKWREGYAVVYGVRRNRDSDSFLKRITASLFYRLFNTLSDIQMPRNAGDFRLIDRRVVEVLKTFPERNRFMKGLFTWVGFRQVGVPYTRPPRLHGKTSWNYWRLWNFALDGITGFTTLPLRLCGYFGLLVAALAFIYSFLLIIRTLMLGIDVPGYASLMVVVLFLGGVQMFTFGIFGEYLGRLYMEAKQRPVYLVEETSGFDSAVEVE